MSEEGRYRSLLSGNTSFPRALSVQSNSSHRKSGYATDDSSRKYTESWVKDNRYKPPSESEICKKIKRYEDIIDKNRELLI
ncbi:hypothetical protein AVEN_270466-1 [Araneus ventricosus]|uniref:Uncharacterized protein n=1 Tax=Araneus ventricosus TaxID=182803 RepID=A0A4Y2B762_ARAVE|nr:hypothetical protein AVEN_270466-1 [Araneus ventricosus]